VSNFKLVVLALWAAIFIVTVAAIAKLGLAAAPTTFLADLRHPWRMQFYFDLEVHLLLAGCWMIYREQSRLVGVACGVATLFLGGLFTAPYVLIASFRAKGEVGALLMGRHRVSQRRPGAEHQCR
jgi:hypothetical protein